LIRGTISSPFYKRAGRSRESRTRPGGDKKNVHREHAFSHKPSYREGLSCGSSYEKKLICLPIRTMGEKKGRQPCVFSLATASLRKKGNSQWKPERRAKGDCAGLPPFVKILSSIGKGQQEKKGKKSRRGGYAPVQLRDRETNSPSDLRNT